MEELNAWTTPERLSALLPEERAELERAQAGIADAEGHAAAYEEAGACLKGVA